MDRETVRRAADVARICLDEKELKSFNEEIDLLCDLLDTLNGAPECDSFCFDPVGVADVLREDVPKVDDNIENMLRSMPVHEGYVRGPKIV